MIPEPALQRIAMSPPARSWIVAAMILVLHWSAPGVLQLRFAVAGDTPAGFSSSARASQPGSLPRLVSRSVGLEVSLPKSPRSGWLAGGKLDALLARDRAAHRPIASAQPQSTEVPAPRSALSRAFNARAPPRMAV
jgi:hypothetical protein